MASDRVLRPASPADADFLAWALQEASGGLFSTLLGRRAASILATTVAQPAHDLSFEHAVVAESGRDLLGVCQGMPFGTPSSGRALARVAGLRAVRMVAVLAAGRPLFAALARHAPGEWYLQAIAVTAAARGRGVGGVLVDDAFARASRAGCATLTLDVDVANPRARQLYERHGLGVVETSPPASLLGGAHVHRMAGPVAGVAATREGGPPAVP